MSLCNKTALMKIYVLFFVFSHYQISVKKIHRSCGKLGSHCKHHEAVEKMTAYSPGDARRGPVRAAGSLRAISTVIEGP